jgi:hypothetical protein
LDLEVYPVWLGRANNDVVKDEGNEHYKRVHVQWWMLSKKRTMNDVELYLEYWQGKWKCNLSDLMQWLDIDSIVFSFPSRNNITMNNTITISDVHVSHARTNNEKVNALNHR